jgi:hypothetical protein
VRKGTGQTKDRLDHKTDILHSATVVHYCRFLSISFVFAFPSRSQAQLKNFSFQLSMDLIMEEFWDLNSTGFEYDGYLNVPYIVSFCADLEETWQAASRLKGGTFCHLKRRMPDEEFLNHEVRY